MNYRHVYHAGNFADVLKHATIALICQHLQVKPAAFRVIDTHAGIGSYDLTAPEVAKTGEWHQGFGRLVAEPLPPDIATILAPYLEAVGHQGARSAESMTRYPGSPLIARHFLRPQDRMTVNELHPEDVVQLRAEFARDRHVKVHDLDGWTALKSWLPPPERRGLILIDPPFEEPGEFARLTAVLADGVRRFATGTFVLWYPIKDAAAVYAFKRELVATAIPKMLGVELLVKATAGTGLAGCGLAIVNPPFQLKAALERLLPFLAHRLAQGPGYATDLRWLVPERAA